MVDPSRSGAYLESVGWFPRYELAVGMPEESEPMCRFVRSCTRQPQKRMVSESLALAATKGVDLAADEGGAFADREAREREHDLNNA